MTGQALRVRKKSIFCIVLLLFGLVALPLVLDAESSFLIYFLYMSFIYVSVAQGWNLVAGYTGQVSLGQHAFFGVGAYVTAMSWKAGLTGYLDPVAFLASGGIAAVVAALIGLPLLGKLRDDYFALGTLGFAEIIRIVFIQGKDITGGPIGIMLPSGSYAGMTPYYYVSLFIAVLTLVCIWFFIHSRIGLGFVAIREDEQAAEANGIPLLRMKILAFSVGAFFTGLCGSLTAYYSFHIHPGGVFTISWGLLPLLMTILGGVGTFWGPVLGAFILAGAFELANMWMPELHTLISGVFIVLVTMFIPRGVISLIKTEDGSPVLYRLGVFRRLFGISESGKGPAEAYHTGTDRSVRE